MTSHWSIVEEFWHQISGVGSGEYPRLLYINSGNCEDASTITKATQRKNMFGLAAIFQALRMKSGATSMSSNNWKLESCPLNRVV